MMGRRRDFFFKEQSFVWRQQYSIANDQLYATPAPKMCDEIEQASLVRRVESVSLSLILGWEDVAPSNPSQTSDVLPQIIQRNDFNDEGWECTDFSDQNKMSHDSFSHSNSQCIDRKVSSIYNMLTLHEASHAVSENILRPCGIPTMNDTLEQVPRTEYGRELLDVTLNVRSFRLEPSLNDLK